MLERYIRSKNTLLPLTDDANLAKYYDIYDIALEDLENIELTLSQRNLDDQYSLRSLRDLFGKLYTARKIVLCCLLALSADGGGSDIARWSSAVEEMRELAAVTGTSMSKMASILNEEDSKCPMICSDVTQRPRLIVYIYRGYPNSTFPVAFRFPKQGPPARASSEIELPISRSSCLACQNAYHRRGDERQFRTFQHQ